MRKALLAAAVLALARAAAAEPGGRATEPPAALVWVPPENFSQWSRLDEVLRARPDLKLTVALTPGMASVLVKDVLGPWTKAGRVEVAARVPGDPVLPLVAAHPAAPRPDDALERPAAALKALGARLGAAPAGFVPGAGALEPSLIQPLGASGAAWVLAGPYVAGSSWAAAGRAAFVPARLGAHDVLLGPADLVAPGATVLDESGDETPRALDALARLPRGTGPAAGWVTVSELLAARGASAEPGGRAAEPGGRAADAGAVAAWPAWDGAPAAAPSDPGARAAYDAYGEAARALARYRDSGAADLKVLEAASALLRRAQDARFFRPVPGAAGAPAELRARLLAVYRRLRVPAPASLYAVAAATAPASELPTGVRAASGPGWVSFDDPAGSLARSPRGAASEDEWRLKGLRVEWDDERVLFRIAPALVKAVPSSPRPIYDVYVDLNHVVGAGRLRLLEGRGDFAQARDAWEFALAVAGGDARLWRAGAGAEPEEIAAFKAEADAAHGEIRVSVPRALLRGNPARWGYLVVSLAEDPARPGKSPAAVLSGGVSAALGLLGSLEAQRSLLENPAVAHRLSAVRLPEPARP